MAAAGLAALVLLAAGTVLAVSFLHRGHHGAAAASAPRSTPALPVQFGPTTPTPTTLPTTASSTTASTTTASAGQPGQAAASTIDADIARSVAARTLIGPANAHTGACRATAADVAALDRAAGTRTDLVAALGRLDVHALPNGATVVSDLRTAWTFSARADLAYAAWARHHLACTGHAPTVGDADWERAHHNDLQSTAAKVVAVQDWNAVARRYHLSARAADKI